MADKKISELDPITGGNTAADDLFLIVDSSGSVTKKITREELNNAIEQDVLSTVDINGGTIDATVIGSGTPAAGTFTDLTASGTVTGITQATGNELENLVEDTTPQLGGDLDLNSNNITGTGNIPSANLTGALPAIDGSALTSLTSGNLTGALPAIDGSALTGLPSGDVVSDTTPQLGGNLDLNSNDITGTGNINNTGTITTDGLTVDGDVTLNDGSPNLRLQDTDTSRYIDAAYGTRAASFTNTMASGEDMDTVQPWINFRFKDDGETREVLRLNYNGNVGIGTSSAATKLHVAGSGNFAQTFRIEDTSVSGRRLEISYNSTSPYIWVNNSEPLAFYTGDSERMRLDSSGKLGIGTSSPSELLDVYSGSTNARIQVQTNNSSSVPAIEFRNTAAGCQIGMPANANAMTFTTADNERLRIESDGAQYVNTDNDTTIVWRKSPSSGGVFGAKLTVSDSGSSTRLDMSVGSSSSRRMMGFTNPNGMVGQIQTSGTSTSYLTSSDYRLKENVTYDWDATTRLKQLKPARFNFIADPDTTVDGFLAHECSAVPEAIAGTHNEIDIWTQHEIDSGDAPDGTSAGDNKLDSDGNTIPVMQSIDQSKLVPLLVKTIQELEARIAALEAN